MQGLYDTIIEAYREYDATKAGIRNHSSVRHEAMYAGPQQKLQGKLEPAYVLLAELDKRDDGFQKEQAALDIVRTVNNAIHSLLVSLTVGETPSKTMQVVFTDPRHIRQGFAVSKPLWQLTWGLNDIGKVRELIDELTSRYVVSHEIPLLTVDYHLGYGDIRLTFEFPY